MTALISDGDALGQPGTPDFMLPVLRQYPTFLGVRPAQVYLLARALLVQVWLQARVPPVPGPQEVWSPLWLYSLLQ